MLGKHLAHLECAPEHRGWAAWLTGVLELSFLHYGDGQSPKTNFEVVIIASD